jgi:hypothetical protein
MITVLGGIGGIDVEYQRQLAQDSLSPKRGGYHCHKLNRFAHPGAGETVKSRMRYSYPGY